MSRLQGDPRNVMLNVGYVSPEQWEAWGEEFHLDKPMVVQYFIWVGKGFFQGDFGESLKTGKPVFDMCLCILVKNSIYIIAPGRPRDV